MRCLPAEPPAVLTVLAATECYAETCMASGCVVGGRRGFPGSVGLCMAAGWHPHASDPSSVSSLAGGSKSCGTRQGRLDPTHAARLSQPGALRPVNAKASASVKVLQFLRRRQPARRRSRLAHRFSKSYRQAAQVSSFRSVSTTSRIRASVSPMASCCESCNSGSRPSESSRPEPSDV
jgi:hypothetical protein